MAYVIEIATADGAVRQVSLDDDNTVIAAQPGAVYRMVTTGAAQDTTPARLVRFEDDLLIRDLPDDQVITISDFFSVCGESDSTCAVQLDTLGGESWDSLTPDAEPIAALTNGEFLLWASPTLDTALPVAPESEFSYKPIAGVVGGLAIIGGAGGGSGEDAAVGSDSTPDRPSLATEIVASRFPEITGQAPPGSTVTIVISPGGSGDNVSYRVTADAQGNWAVNTATATPLAGALPADGLPIDAPSPIAIAASNSAGNSDVVNGQLEIDTTPPAETASLTAVITDALAPSGQTDLNIVPGEQVSGASTNDTSPTLTGRLSAPLASGDAVLIVRNAVVIGEATVSGLNWSFTDSVNESGEFTYQAQVSDSAGNRSAGSETFVLRIDGTAPRTPGIDPIASDDVISLAEAQAGIVISGSADPGTTVDVTLGAFTQQVVADGNGVYAAPFDQTNLPGNGQFTVRVSSQDSFGNVSETAERPVGVATGLPAAPAIDLNTAPLSGDVPAINAAESASGFDISGFADPGNDVVVSFLPVNGGQAITASGTVDGNGQFTIGFPAGALADGNYTLQASITDLAGQVVDGPAVPLLVDTGIPGQQASILDATDSVAEITGRIGNGSVTNDNTPTLNGTLSAGIGANEFVDVQLNGQTAGRAEVAGTNWQFTGAPLPEGPANWTVRVVDAAGNAGPDSEPFGLTLDLTSPAAPTVDVVAGDDVVTAGDSDGGITVSGRATPGDSVTVEWADQTRQAETDASGNWQTTFATPPAEGRTQVTASVTDAAGNAAEAFRTVTVDTVPPPAPGIASVGNNNVVNASLAASGVTVSGMGEAGSVVSVQWGTLTQSATVSNAGFWSMRFDQVPGDGQTTIRASASDAGSNVSAVTERTVQVDTSPPATPILAPVEQDNAVDAQEASDGVPVSGTTGAGANVLVRWAGQERTTTADGQGRFSVQFDTVPAEGESVITAVATDAAGNNSAAGQVAVTVNTTLPPPLPQVDSVGNDNSVNAALAQAGVQIAGSAQAGARVVVQWGGAQQSTSADDNGNWQVQFAANQVPGDGETEVRVVASNAGGDSPAALQPVVVDTTAPDIPVIDAVTGDDTVDASDAADGVLVSGQAEPASRVTVRWGNLTQTSSVDADGRWSTQFDTVPEDGESSVQVSAQDSLGNTSPVASRVVSINTVQPPEAPAINTVAGDDVINAQEAQAGIRITGSSQADANISVSWAGNTEQVTASASGSWSLVIGSDSIVDDGTVQIAATATNAGGTSEVAGRTVVIDRQPPDAPAIDPVTGDNLIDATESAGPVSVSGTGASGESIEVSWGNTSAETTVDDDGNWSVRFSRLPAGDGDSLIEAIATDAAGNVSAPSELSVTINSVEAPGAPTIAPVASDDRINASEASTGIELGGTAAPGSTVEISWGDLTRQAVVDSNGDWVVSVAPGAIPDDGDSLIRAVASNAGGASEQTERAVTVDTTSPLPPEFDAIGGDDVISPAEAAGPILVSGSAEPGSEVTVTWSDVQQTTTTEASGAWSVSFDSLPADATAELTATARDDAGNPSDVQIHPVTIEAPTEPPGAPGIDPVTGDNVINAAEAADDITITGTADAGSLVTLVWDGPPLELPVDENGNWQTAIAADEIPDDGFTVLSAVSTVGEQSSESTSLEVLIDTEAPGQVVTITEVLDNSGAAEVSLASGDETADITPTLVLDLDLALATGDRLLILGNGETLAELTGAETSSVELDELAPGEYSFAAQVVDAAGNAAPLSDPFVVLISPVP